jgi:hypothetical protein
LDWQILRARKTTDKAVTPILVEGETLRWSGAPGFVATFNSGEAVFAAIITAMITIITVIMFGTTNHLPIEANAMLTAFTCGLILLFIGWVRQICRYVTTLGLYYAVTDSRIMIIKNKSIVAEMPIESIKSTAVKKKPFGNGTVVFNQGSDYFKRGNIIESPPNPRKGVFAFFNVLDPSNAIEAVRNGQS